MTQGRRVSLHAYLSVSLFTIVSIWVRRGSYSSANQKPALCLLTNERPGQFLLRGASDFLLKTQTRPREKAKVLLTYLYPFTGKYIYKGTSLSREKKHLIFENIQKTFHQILDKWAPRQFFSLLYLRNFWSRLLFLQLFINWGDRRQSASKYAESVRECVKCWGQTNDFIGAIAQVTTNVHNTITLGVNFYFLQTLGTTKQNWKARPINWEVRTVSCW